MAKRKISHRRHDRRHPATPRPELAPDGMAWIYGTHAVEAALDNPQRSRNRLVATAEAANRLRSGFPLLKPEILDRHSASDPGNKSGTRARPTRGCWLLAHRV